MEYVPEEMKKNGAKVIHLATGLVVGYPPCSNIRRFKVFIETTCWVARGHRHPSHSAKIFWMPMKKLPLWLEGEMAELIKPLLDESPEIKAAYN